jgi:hypothetical protein
MDMAFKDPFLVCKTLSFLHALSTAQAKEPFSITTPTKLLARDAQTACSLSGRFHFAQ